MAKKPTSADKVVGQNIRFHRLAGGLSQSDLGHKLGVSFQQVQKYERGTNRVGSGRLLLIASILGLPVTSFFEGAKLNTPAKGPSPLDLRCCQ